MQRTKFNAFGICLLSFCFLFGCKRNGKEEAQIKQISLTNGALFKGHPIGEWNYYDENKNILKRTFYLDSTGRNYESKYYSRSKLVYSERITNDKVVFTEPLVDNYAFGKMLFNEYCQNCHSLASPSIGPALYPSASENGPKKFANSVSNEYHRKRFILFNPPITTRLDSLDIACLYEYISKAEKYN